MLMLQAGRSTRLSGVVGDRRRPLRPCRKYLSRPFLVSALPSDLPTPDNIFAPRQCRGAVARGSPGPAGGIGGAPRPTGHREALMEAIQGAVPLSALG